MPKQFLNPEITKVEEKATVVSTPAKRLSLLAEKAARKSSKTIHNYEKQNMNLFSK